MMPRRLRPWLPLLTLLLSWQWGSAAAHCLAHLAATGSGGQQIEICTAEGMRMVTLPGDAGAPMAVQHDACPGCPALGVPAPEGPATAPQRVAYAAFLPPSRAGMPPAPARAPPQQPRAPPIA